MRTTLEIPDEQRARLLELAARRGRKGFSFLIQEALEQYLRDQESQDDIQRALSAKGQLAGAEAEALEQSVIEIRNRWR